jgi:hypothetical protein
MQDLKSRGRTRIGNGITCSCRHKDAAYRFLELESSSVRSSGLSCCVVLATLNGAKCMMCCLAQRVANTCVAKSEMNEMIGRPVQCFFAELFALLALVCPWGSGGGRRKRLWKISGRTSSCTRNILRGGHRSPHHFPIWPNPSSSVTIAHFLFLP